MKKLIALLFACMLLIGTCGGALAEKILLDEVAYATDSQGNSTEINPKEKSWLADHTVTIIQFYDAGIRSGKHYYEVHMSSTVDDSYYYYTYHQFKIMPTTDTTWKTSTVTHNTVDHKTSVGDSISYSYPVGSEPASPKVKVSAKFTIQNYGSFTLPTKTLSNPIN